MNKIILYFLCLLTFTACSSEEGKTEEKKRRFVDPSTIKKEASVFEPYVIEDSSKIFYTEHNVGVYVVEEGPGSKPEPLTPVLIHYYGMLTDGTKFDSSYDRGEPYSWSFGMGNVIQGWNEGLANLTYGTKVVLIIPPDMGYGKRGAPPNIPPDATLIFHIHLVGRY